MTAARDVEEVRTASSDRGHDAAGDGSRRWWTRTLASAVLAVRDEVAKVVVGQEGTLSGLVAALLVRGHVLLEGVPGVGQDAAGEGGRRRARPRLPARAVHARPHAVRRDRPDDLSTRARARSAFREGPVFTNLLLADEINRTPPKTQAALLEAMEERQVSVEGDHAPAARSVHRRRHPEPGRVRGHLPAARGAARPLPVQAASSATRPPSRSRRCSPATTPGSIPTTCAPRACARSPAPPTSPRPAPRSTAVRVEPAGARVHRRARAGDARVAVAHARRVAPWRGDGCCTRRRRGRGCPAGRSSRPTR